MNTLPFAEIRRRGMDALEERLKLGPVHILKHNRPAAVVLSEEEYQRLSARAAPLEGAMLPANSAIEYLLSLPAGDSTPEAVMAQIEHERGAWQER